VPRGNSGPGSVIAAKCPVLPKVFEVLAPEIAVLGSVRAVGATQAGGSNERRRIGTSHRASAPTTSNAAASGHQGATGNSTSSVVNPAWLDDERGNPAAAASAMKEPPPELDSIVAGWRTGSIAAILGAASRVVASDGAVATRTKPLGAGFTVRGEALVATTVVSSRRCAAAVTAAAVASGVVSARR